MQFDSDKTIFLIDGSSFLYRAYYSMRPLHTIHGQPVHAIYSFCRMTKKLIDLFSPSHIALVWDSKGKTSRHELYNAYKATRQAPPSDLFEQKDKIKEFAELIGLKQVEQAGIEADDLMYSIARDLSAQDNTVVLVTSDKDMGQALRPGIVLYDPFKEEFFDQEQFEQKKGIGVNKLPFYYALLGDASDNIPGVKGIGEKTAHELVSQFESLATLYDQLDRVSKPRIRELLASQKEQAFLSQQLFLLQYHSLGLNQEDFQFKVASWPKAQPLFEELGFKSLLRELGQTHVDVEKTIEEKIKILQQYEFITVTTPELLAQLCQQLQLASAFACDTETDALDPFNSNLVGLSICMQEGRSFYIPCGHQTNQTQLSCKEIVAALNSYFVDSAKKKYFHNAKYDLHVLKKAGIDVQGMVFDTLIAASLVTKNWQRAGLKYLSSYYLNQEMLTFDDVVKSKKLKNFSYVPLDLATYYAANDAHQTLRIMPIMQKELNSEHMEQLYYDIEFPLVELLYKMEQRGIFVDVNELKQLKKQVTADLTVIEQQICDLIGIDCGAINLNSPKQLQELLFVTLQLTLLKKSAKGGYSTDHEVLLELAKEHPVPALLVNYRELFKLKSTYIDALPGYVNLTTKKIHTTYNQFAVATGRLASSDPNLQNIPLGGASGYGSQIRAAFKPEPQHLFLSADYSQIELRVLAYLSQDARLIEAFNHKEDIHNVTASKLFDVSINEVTSAQRQIGKRINFSILYGMTPYGLSKDLGISYADAKRYIDTYFAQYPQVQQWMEKVVEYTKKHGYVTTHWGRRRYIPAIYERNRSLYEEGRRIAINTAGQGTAAEIVKKGMLELDRVLTTQFPQAHILLQIHDELILTVPQEQITALEPIVKSTLENVTQWNVPLEVSIRTGSNWKEVSK